MKSFFKTYWTYFVSFIIPVLIMTGVYLTQGIYWNSDTSPLLGDGFHQYVIFDVALRNILHGNGSLFYTFTSGLGLNFYALSSYYLGSFLSPLVYFFNLSNMPDAVYLTTLLKFGLIGLSTFFSLSRLFKDIPEDSYVYFVHSYYLKAEDEGIVTATTEYSTHIHASVEQGNVFACQFHPEKSSDIGIQILKNFVEL